MFKAFLKILPFLFLGNFAFAQMSGIKVRVIDSATNQPLPFAQVLVEQGDRQIGGTTTDVDGYAELKPLDPGNYNVRAVFGYYKDLVIKNVHVSIDSLTLLTLQMVDTNKDTSRVMIIRYMKCFQENWQPICHFIGDIPVEPNDTSVAKHVDSIICFPQMGMEAEALHCLVAGYNLPFSVNDDIIIKSVLKGEDINCLAATVPGIYVPPAWGWSTGSFYKDDISRMPSNDIHYVQDFFPLSKLNGFPVK